MTSLTGEVPKDRWDKAGGRGQPEPCHHTGETKKSGATLRERHQESGIKIAVLTGCWKPGSCLHA
jgi:hypothetical protein